MKIKANELEGSALDWAVATSLNGSAVLFDVFGIDLWGKSITECVLAGKVKPSTEWSQGGQIIERYRLDLRLNIGSDDWLSSQNLAHYNSGPTPLIAAMRALVYSQLGSEVEIPEGLEG
jgi:hypothetical protein